jgi:hypothetical protein
MSISDKPAVYLESTPSYLYQLNVNYTLQCKIVGFPQPQVAWYFNDCDLMNDCEEFNFKEIQVRYLLQSSEFLTLIKLGLCVDKFKVLKM